MAAERLPGQGQEGVRTPENIIITPESLLADNHSEKAKELSAAWVKNRDSHNLWGIVTCGDARIITPRPDNIISVRSIATAGTKEKRIFESEGIKFTVVMSHIDGETIEDGKRPKGCGGLGAKEDSLNGNGNNGQPVEGIQYYVENNIEHPDPVLQALLSARKIRNITGKPTLAVIQNHRTGKVYPFAAFLPGFQTIASNLDGVDLEEYSPSKIYAHGIPTLPNDAIPEIFREFMEANAQQVNEMLMIFPHLTEMQRVQNPRMVVISSKLPSVRIRYPETTNFPGFLFKLFLSREKEKPGKIRITTATQKEVIGQAEYALTFALANSDQPGKPFSKTDRVLIETSDINASRNLAEELGKRPWMQRWSSLSDHKVLVAQNIEGISNVIEEFTA